MKIEVKNVSKDFKKINVLKDVNMYFESGNIYGLYGRNGSGKSVLLKLLCGFLKPSSGEILFDGKNLNMQKELPRNLRALIEHPSFFPDVSGLDNLKILSEIQNKIGEKEILETLDIVNLRDEKDKKYSEYSLGMKQKLGIAQVLMEDPEVLLLDEPFNGIEQESVIKIMDYLKKLKHQKKIILISTHIKEDLEHITDKIYYFDAGNVSENEK